MDENFVGVNDGVGDVGAVVVGLPWAVNCPFDFSFSVELVRDEVASPREFMVFENTFGCDEQVADVALLAVHGLDEAGGFGHVGEGGERLLPDFFASGGIEADNIGSEPEFVVVDLACSIGFEVGVAAFEEVEFVFTQCDGGIDD